MPITREQWLDVESATYEFWDKENSRRKDFNAMLYNVQESDKSQENHLGIGSIGQMSPWTGSVDYQEFTKGFDQGYRHSKYSSGIQFEEELFRFREYNQMKKRTRKLNLAVYKTLMAHGVSTFNNAFDSGFTGPDDVALCSDSHPYSPEDSTTQSNTFALELTMPNLKTVYNDMLEFTDDHGDMLFTQPNILLTGIYYREEAMKICGSNLPNEKEPFTADNDANIYQDLTHIYHPMITGKKWFLIDQNLMEDALNWYNARVPAIATEQDFDTEVQKYKVVGMWSYGWDDWSFIAGSNAA
jgi:hypothetical protein